jgi:hypothetical protein
MRVLIAAASLVAVATIGDAFAQSGAQQRTGTSTLAAPGTVQVPGSGTQFGGQYYVRGTTHQYGEPAGPNATLTTKGKTTKGSPGTNDEVLVGFEHGDQGKSKSGKDSDKNYRVKIKFPWLPSE